MRIFLGIKEMFLNEEFLKKFTALKKLINLKTGTWK